MKVADLTNVEIDKAIARRAPVRITWAGGRESLAGVTGILLGYNRQYHTFKVGFIDANGRYTGEKTVVSYNSIELIEDVPAPAAPQNINEEDSLPIDNGPLTERQTAIIGHVRAGLRYRKVAEKLGVSEVLVRQEVVTINRKLRAATLQQAIGIYATAQAYREVANALDYASRAHPEQDGVAEDHVNHVLMALAAVYRDRAVRLLPQ